MVEGLTCFRVDTSLDLGEASVRGRLFLLALGGCVKGSGGFLERGAFTSDQISSCLSCVLCRVLFDF